MYIRFWTDTVGPRTMLYHCTENVYKMFSYLKKVLCVYMYIYVRLYMLWQHSKICCVVLLTYISSCSNICSEWTLHGAGRYLHVNAAVSCGACVCFLLISFEYTWLCLDICVQKIRTYKTITLILYTIFHDINPNLGLFWSYSRNLFLLGFILLWSW